MVPIKDQLKVYKKVSVHISKLSPNMASNVYRERRMLNLVITLVCCYVTCWLPYHATRIFMFFAPPSWYACNQIIFGKLEMVD